MSTDSISVAVGATATYTLVLDSQPTGSVTVSATSDGTAKATVAPATRVFTTTNWSTPQEIVVTGVATGTPDIDHAVSVANNAGGYPTSLSIADIDVTVAATVLGITVDDKTRVYGETDDLSYTVTGLASGDTEANVLMGALARASG